MSWAETKKINSDMSKPLDVLIEEKNNVKIQTVSFNLTANVSAITVTANIDEIDISKSIIYISSFINMPNTAAISIGFNSSTQAFVKRTPSSGKLGEEGTISATIITFGGDVTK